MSFYISRKERIILTSIEIMDELGFQSLSTKEICRRQEVSEGTLYKHFRSKNDVILGVLNYYSKFDEDIKQTIEMKNMSATEGITYFIARFAEYYESYPAMTAIQNSHEVLRNEAGVADKVIEIFESRTNFISYLVEKGRENGEINADIDSESLSDVVLGTFQAICLKWRMRNYNFPLKQRILTAHEKIMRACQKC